MLEALTKHWPEYLMEAALLGMFMISACFFATLFEFPSSPVRMALTAPFPRHLLGGIAMGLTAIALIYSPWGKQSGAHFNPSVTLTFFRLGKVKPWDAAFYVAAQFAGGIAGVLIAGTLLGKRIMDPTVNYVATTPGPGGPWIAFIAESLISFGLMSVVLFSSNTPRLSRYTGILAGILVATYITFEAPLSGMSMNPARTFGSAFPSRMWSTLWIYFTAPLLGMLLAAQFYLSIRGARGVICAKFHHHNDKRCIFHCGYKVQNLASPVAAGSAH
jgi:aquaporin Z